MDSLIRNRAPTKSTISGRNGSAAPGRTAAARVRAMTLAPTAMVHARRGAADINRGSDLISGSANVTRLLGRGEGRAEANSAGASHRRIGTRTGQVADGHLPRLEGLNQTVRPHLAVRMFELMTPPQNWHD